MRSSRFADRRHPEITSVCLMELLPSFLMELLTGLMELLPYFLCARLSAAVVISLSSPGFKCCFRALLHFVRSQVQSQPRHSVAVDTLHISYADIFISEVMACGCSPPQCLLTLDYVLWDYGEHDPTIAVCIVYAEYTGKTSTRQDTGIGYTLSCHHMSRTRRMLLM